MHLGFKARLSLWHMVIVAVILAVAAFGSNWALARLVRGQVDGALVELARAEATALAADGTSGIRIHEAAPGTAAPSFVRLDKFIQIAALDGRVIARSSTLGTARLPARPGLLVRVGAGETVFQTVEDFGEEPIRMVSLPVTIGADTYVVQVATSLDDARAVLRGARWLFLVVSLAILGAVVATGALLAWRALRPIDQIVSRARRIGESSLADRLPHPRTQDEIGRLVETLNDMLERIERSFEVQRRFTADASHELRSPLSRLRAELEVTLRRPRDPAEYEEALRSCLDEVERLSWLTEELLGLARLDAGEGQEPPTGAVPLPPIVEEAVRRLAPEAERRNVTFVAHPCPDLSVKAAPGAASLAVANVLDNAVKFSPAGGCVTVSVFAEGDEAVVTVADTGSGVLPEEIPRLFERFHRGSAARLAEAPGTGLGLAISRALVEGQGGRIAVESIPGRGATFSIRLPLAGSRGAAA
jgi:two-component system OmpR family sensor kinase